MRSDPAARAWRTASAKAMTECVPSGRTTRTWLARMAPFTAYFPDAVRRGPGAPAGPPVLRTGPSLLGRSFAKPCEGHQGADWAPRAATAGPLDPPNH